MKKCKKCKEPMKFTEFNGLKTYFQKFGLCKNSNNTGCYFDWIKEGSPRAQKVIESSILKGKKAVASKVKKKKIDEKELLKQKTKTLSNYKSDLQKQINLIIRLIDKGHPCIATGTYDGKFNAGHYMSVGSNDTIRFHLENIWLQSEHSNNWKAGDTLRYQDGIVELYGNDYLERLNSLKSIQPIKLTKEDIIDKISVCRGIVKWIKLQDRKFDVKERLELRVKFNKKIGIY